MPMTEASSFGNVLGHQYHAHFRPYEYVGHGHIVIHGLIREKGFPFL